MLRWQCCEKNYFRGRKKMKLWSHDGVPLWHRHRLNQRDLKSKVEEYAAGIIKKGLMAMLRGVIMGVQEDEDEQFISVVAGGTLVEAIYVATRMQPDNEYIQAICVLYIDFLHFPNRFLNCVFLPLP